VTTKSHVNPAFDEGADVDEGAGIVRRRPLQGLLAALALSVAACGAASPTPVPAAFHLENRTGDTFIVEIDQRNAEGTPAYVIGLPPCGGAWDIHASDSGVPARDWQIVALVADDGDLGSLVPAGPIVVDGTPPEISMSIAWSTGEIAPTDLPRVVTFRPEGAAVTTARDTSPVASGCEPWIGEG
jgi:hypothetical protein